MHFERSLIFSTLITSLWISSHSQLLGLPENSACGNAGGTCRRLRNCPLIGNPRSSRPLLCSFVDREPVVCCPQSRAHEMCMLYDQMACNAVEIARRRRDTEDQLDETAANGAQEAVHTQDGYAGAVNVMGVELADFTPSNELNSPTSTTAQSSTYSTRQHSTHYPSSTTRQPSSTTHYPSSTTRQPSSTTHYPTSTTRQPSSTTHYPSSTTRQPSSTTHYPSSTTRQPSSTTHYPSSTTRQPSSTTHYPSSTTRQPSSTTHYTSSTTRQSSSTTQYPSSTAKKTSTPSTTTARLKSTNAQEITAQWSSTTTVPSILEPMLTNSSVEDEGATRRLPPGFSLSGISNNDIPEKKIVGGMEVNPRELPYMALIGFGRGSVREWSCGASIISENFVMSAAHCATNAVLGPARWARVAELDLSRSNSPHQDIPIIARFIHPQYREPAVYNDIALFRLGTRLTFSSWVQPICLQVAPQILADKGVAAGWGRTDFVGDTSERLLKVDLTLVDTGQCRNQLGRAGRFLPQGVNMDTMICAGEAQGGKDTCTGDSGGPLVVQGSGQCIRTQVGVVSFGRQCAMPNTPGIYTKVSSFVPWIESIVWPQ